MADAIFVQFEKSALYLPDSVPPAGARCAYLLPANVPTPPSFTLAESLANAAGAFLFFAALPAEAGLGAFSENVQTFLANAPTATRFVWISNPLTTGDGLLATTLQANTQSGHVTVKQVGFINLAPNILLRLTGGTQISAPDSTALVFTATTSVNALLVAPGGVGQQQTLPLSGPATLPFFSVPFPAGCFTCELAPDLQQLGYLGVGPRYFSTDLNPDDPPGMVQAMPYPLFALGAGETLPLLGVADPLDQLNPARTYFQFGTAAGPLTTPPPSYLRSALNAPVALMPQSDARLVFAVDVNAVTDNGQPDPTGPYYLTPAGTFVATIQNTAGQNTAGQNTAGQNTAGQPTAGQPTAGQPTAGQSGQFANFLMCGFSGVEYFNLPAGSGTLRFEPGCPAFAAATQPAGQNGSAPPPIFQPLSAQALTSWAYLQESEEYYAQPESSILHQPDAAHPAFLKYLPALAGQLTPPPTATAAPSGPLGGVLQAFPLAPYAGVQPGPFQNYPAFEAQVLNPARRTAIYNINPNYAPNYANTTAKLQTATPVSGTTPQGLLLQLAGNQWDELTLAQTPDNGQTSLLQLSNVRGAMQAALQTNQLFAVVSSSAKLLANADIPNYKLTVQSWTDLEQSQNPPVTTDVLKKLKPLQDQPFTSLAAYQSALQAALGGDYQTYAALLVQVGASFGVTIQAWRFDLSPYFWHSYNTLLIFKFINSPFASLASDTTAWAQAGALNDDPTGTQQALLAFIREAQQSNDPNLAYFRDTVLNDPSWNGILALRVRVPLSALPAELEGVAAGIDPSQFFAHHIGITVTPVQSANGQLTAQNSTLFGLLRYNDPSDLSDQSSDYDFKVQSLSVLFVNSEVNNFASQIELLVNRLFAEPVQLQNSASGNNLKLTGFYQKHGNTGSYVFQNTDTNVYQVSSQVLDQVVISQAQFVTLVQNGPQVQTRFRLTGSLSFKALKDFDIFSFGASDGGSGGLAYTNLSVDMSFPPDSPNHKTFAFDAQTIAFNTAASVARPASLYPRFPLKLSGLTQAATGQTPATLNFMPVDSPLTGSQLAPPWFGLVFDLNLGTLGALAGQAGFIAALLLGWQPNTAKPAIYIGLQIPGAKGGKREISLEGIIKLTFGDLRFVVAGPGAYILQLRNIALSVLSVSFPPGQTDLLLFGDPSGQDNSTLGWYAAYKKADQGGGQQPSNQAPAQLPAGD